MSDLKITPGPWFVHDHRDLNDRYWIGPEKFMTIADVRNGADDEEYGGAEAQLANAHLIAAAPDLYAALVEALRVAPCNADEDPELVTFYSQVRAAMAKARGETIATNEANAVNKESA